LPRGTSFTRWRAALHAGLEAIKSFGADALVVALGVDTFEGDPISGFTLRSADYLTVGEDIAAASCRPCSCSRAATRLPRSASTPSRARRFQSTISAPVISATKRSMPTLPPDSVMPTR